MIEQEITELVRWKAEADVLSGRACAENVAAGRGPCGACVGCLRRQIDEIKNSENGLLKALLKRTCFGCGETSCQFCQWAIDISMRDLRYGGRP